LPRGRLGLIFDLGAPAPAPKGGRIRRQATQPGRPHNDFSGESAERPATSATSLQVPLSEACAWRKARGAIAVGGGVGERN